MIDFNTANLCDILNQINDDNWLGEEDTPDFLQELKDAAWNVVWENAGIAHTEWIDTLIRQYPAEVVDAFGTNPSEVYHKLADLWEMEFTNPTTGEYYAEAEAKGFRRAMRHNFINNSI